MDGVTIFALGIIVLVAAVLYSQRRNFVSDKLRGPLPTSWLLGRLPNFSEA